MARWTPSRVATFGAVTRRSTTPARKLIAWIFASRFCWIARLSCTMDSRKTGALSTVPIRRFNESITAIGSSVAGAPGNMA